MNRFILITIILCCIQTVKAEVTGRIRNTDSEPVQGATLVLLELPDSTYVNGAVSGADGAFAITGGDKAGQQYCLKVQAYGYETVNVELNSNTTKPLDISLSLASTELSEIVVKGKTPVITREGGKFIFIPNNLADGVTNARKLMDYVPLVEWDNTRASIIGKGASKVYLNGKDPHWEHNELSAMLRTLDPHYIKRVEIITEPGASQSASFTGGVINIIYDDPTQGFRGNIFAYTGLSDDNPMVWPNLWLYYQKNRFKASFNMDYYYNHDYTHSTNRYDYTALNRFVTNDSKSTSFNNMINGKLNLSYDLTPRSVVGAAVSLGTSRSHSKLTVNTVTRDEAGNEGNSTMRQTMDTHPDKPSIGALAYYTLSLDNKGSMLDILAAYGGTAAHTNINNVFSGISMPQLLEKEQYAFNGKADFTKVFNPTTLFKAGVVFSDVHSTDTQTFDGVFDKFKYNIRQIHAFLQFNKRWNNYISTDIGLRVENTHTQGSQLQDGQTDTQDYTDLFPSFSISWNIPQGSQSLSLSYSNYINRPSMLMLNPYKIWSSNTTYSQGNPYLKPVYSHDISLSYSLLNKLTIYARYSYSSPLTSSYTINTADGMTISSYANTGRRNGFTVIAEFNTMVGNFWQPSVSGWANYANIKSKAEGNNIHSSEWFLLLTQKNTFHLSRTHHLTATFSQTVATPHNYGFYKEEWKYSISAGLSKSFYFGLEADLYVSLPITGYKNYRQYTTPDYSYNLYNHNHQYSVSLTISYSFGKKQVYGATDRTSEIKKP